MLSSALKSWYIVGKLGGFNAGNMQVYHNAAGDLSYMVRRGQGASGRSGSALGEQAAAGARRLAHSHTSRHRRAHASAADIRTSPPSRPPTHPTPGL